MTEQEKNIGDDKAGGSFVVVKQTSSDCNKNKTPYRPNELEEESDVHHKRSIAPAMPSVTELEDNPDTAVKEKTDVKKRKESHRALASNKHKHNFPKKLTSSNKAKRRNISPESIPMDSIESGSKKTVQSKPIPADVHSIESALDVEALENESVNKSEDDGYVKDVTTLRIPPVAKKNSEWSDDEEASGLPRSESRSSRISRVVRQLFCCGVSYEAPSEEDFPTLRRDYKQGI